MKKSQIRKIILKKRNNLNFKNKKFNFGNLLKLLIYKNKNKKIGLYYPIGSEVSTIELIKYLTTDEAQKTYVNNTYEYSVNPNIMPDEIVQAWGKFKKDPLDLNMLGIKREEAIRIFDKTGWK